MLNQVYHTNEVSEDLACQVGSWQHWADLLLAPTNSKPDRPYQPTTQSISDCHISPQNTPCTTEHQPTSHQERTPSKACLLPRPLNISCSTAHWTTTSDPDDCQLNQIYTTRYMNPLHNCDEQPPTICQP